MRINWGILVAVVLIAAMSYWAVDSLRLRTYSGSNLDIDIGTGVVTVTNPSTAAVAVQLVSPGTRSFTVTSSIEGVTGASTRQGSGSTATQLFAFELPSGVSEFSVARGNNVNFVASGAATLDAVVQSVSASEARTILIVTTVVVLSALFYISRATRHGWFSALRRRITGTQAAKPAAETAL
jgi:hypothetical protein